MPYSDEMKAAIKDEIIERISEGTTLRSICREEGMPSWHTVYQWKEEDEEFNSRFARARELGHDAIAEEALAIADTPVEGIEYEDGPMGSKQSRKDMLGHRKLQVETRLKLLAKWNPKKYGDRVEQHHTGGIGTTDASLTDQQKAALDRALDQDV